MARSLSHRLLEKEIVRELPRLKTKEQSIYVTPDRMELKVGLSEAAMDRLRRAQDLLCQKCGKTVTLEETLEVLTFEFLKKINPVLKADRNQTNIRTESKSETESGRENEGENSAPSKLEPVTVQIDLSPLTERTSRKPIPSAILHRVNQRDQGR